MAARVDEPRCAMMRTVLAGVLAAASLGAASGAAMQPNLDLGPRPLGPQMYAGGPDRVAGPFEDNILGAPQVLFTSDGKLPDHVLGTDWLRATQVMPDPMPEPAPEPAFVTYNDPPEDFDPPTRIAADPGDAPPEAFSPASPQEVAAAPAAAEPAGDGPPADGPEIIG